MATAAILGRPNVGKSTLFNRLVGRKIALVDDQPGVTRDRREGTGRDLRSAIQSIRYGGPRRRAQGQPRKPHEQTIGSGHRRCRCLPFVIDAKAGVTPIDREFAGRLRKHGKPVVLVANKCEGRDASAGINEGHTLGFGEPVAISAEHGEGIGDLRDALAPYLATEVDAPIPAEMPLRLAIIGQPNAGKSTLVNTMVGSDRMLTGPEAGITRDAISVDWSWKGKPIKLWDTAGIRRKAKVDGKIEKLAVADALRAIRFADAVIVLIDASMEIENQDLTLSSLVAGEGRAMILVLSKWDLVEDKNKKLKDVKERLEDILPEIKGITMVTISAKQEKGIPKMMDAILKAVEIWDTRLSTSKFNRWLEKALERNPPPAPQGRRIKIRYGTQVKARPPTFALFGNQLEHLPETYVRYLMNGLRKDFELWGTPIAVVWGLTYAVPASIASMLTFNFLFLPPLYTFTLADTRELGRARDLPRHRNRRRRSCGPRAPPRGRGRAARAGGGAARRGRDLLPAGHAGHRGARRGWPSDADEVLRRESTHASSSARSASRRPGESPHELRAGDPPGRARSTFARGPSRTSRSADASSPRSRRSSPSRSTGSGSPREALEAEALRQSDTVKTAVLQAVSHDLRSPLTAIRAAAENLRSATARRLSERRPGRAARDDRDRVRPARAPRARPARSLAAPGGRGGAHARALDDRRARRPGARRHSGPAASGSTVSLPADLPPVQVDAAQVERALANLLENALKFSPPGERVSVRATATRREVIVRVVDHGPGVAAHRA